MSAAGIGSVPLWIGGAVVAGSLAVGAVFLLGQDKPGDDSAATGTVAPAQTAAVRPAETAPEVTEDAAPEPSEASVAPRLDEVRIESGGMAVIAGRAAPFADVILRADGDEIGRLTADSGGAFATVTFLEPSAAARVLSVAEITNLGVESDERDELIIAPVIAVGVASLDAAPAEAEASAGGQTVSTSQAADAAPRVARLQTPPTQSDDFVPDTSDIANAALQDTQVAALDTQGATLGTGSVAVAALDLATGTPDSPNALGTPEGLPAPAGLDAAPDTDDLAAAQQAQDPDLQDQVAALDASVSDASDQPAGALASLSAPATSGATPQPAAPERPQSFAVLRANEDGVDVVQPVGPSPDAMSQVALDAISYSLEGDVQLTGRAQSSADQVQVYLDNQPITSLRVDDEGAWRGALPNVDSGVYTLRIDEVDDLGKVTSRVETPFKREDPQVLRDVSASAQTDIAAITVQSGATLWAIARDRYGDGTLYVRVFEANKDAIRDPDLIYPGQIFNLPEN